MSTETSRHNSIPHFKKLFLSPSPGIVVLTVFMLSIVMFVWLFPAEPFYYEQFRLLGHEAELQCLTANGNASAESYGPCTHAGLVVEKLTEYCAVMVAFLLPTGVACALLQLIYRDDSSQSDTMEGFARLFLYPTVSTLLTIIVVFIGIKHFQPPFLPTRPAPDFEISQLNE